MPGIKVPLPIIPGLDVAGEVVEIGPGVDGWKTGDRVLVNPLHPQKGLMGEMLDGGLAEYCLASAKQLIRIPEGVTYEQAASRSEEHTSELQSLMRISYAVFCLKKKNKLQN